MLITVCVKLDLYLPDVLLTLFPVVKLDLHLPDVLLTLFPVVKLDLHLPDVLLFPVVFSDDGIVVAEI